MIFHSYVKLPEGKSNGDFHLAPRLCAPGPLAKVMYTIRESCEWPGLCEVKQKQPSPNFQPCPNKKYKKDIIIHDNVYDMHLNKTG